MVNSNRNAEAGLGVLVNAVIPALNGTYTVFSCWKPATDQDVTVNLCG